MAWPRATLAGEKNRRRWHCCSLWSNLYAKLPLQRWADISEWQGRSARPARITGVCRAQLQAWEWNNKSHVPPISSGFIHSVGKNMLIWPSDLLSFRWSCLFSGRETINIALFLVSGDYFSACHDVFPACRCLFLAEFIANMFQALHLYLCLCSSVCLLLNSKVSSLHSFFPVVVFQWKI